MHTLFLCHQKSTTEISREEQQRHPKLLNKKSKTPIIVRDIIPKKLYAKATSIKGIDHHVVLKVLCVLWSQQTINIKNNHFQFFPLSSKYKIKILNGNRDHYGIYKAIEDNAIIESTSYSKSRNQCKNVRLNPDYTNGEMVEISYTQFYTVEMNLDPSSKKVLDTLQKLNLPFNDLAGIIELVKSKRALIEDNIKSKISETGTYNKKKIKFDQSVFIQEKAELISNIHITRLYRLLDIKSSYCSRNATNGRMDHPLTNFPKMYLHHFKIDREPLIEIDFKNCQPTLLSHLFLCIRMENQESWLYNVNFFVSMVDDSIETSNKWESRETKSCITHSLFSDLKKVVCQSDITAFIDNTYSGNLYESFLDENNIGNNLDRDTIKKLIWKAIFGQYKYVKDVTQIEVINQTYPNLLQAIQLLKQIFAQIEYKRSITGLKDTRRPRLAKRKKTAEKAGNDDLAILLQNLESWLFIDQILPILQTEDLDVIPRHDSFLVKESQAEQAYKIIYNTLTKILGNDKFSLRIEKLNVSVH